MKIIGSTVLTVHPIRSNIRFNIHEFKVIRNGWTATIEPNSITDGASVPWPFSLIWKPFNSDYSWKALVHDELCGQFKDPIFVANKNGVERQLSWKEAASWFRDLMQMGHSNRKIRRRLFYHAIMMKKRVGQKE